MTKAIALIGCAMIALGCACKDRFVFNLKYVDGNLGLGQSGE